MIFSVSFNNEEGIKLCNSVPAVTTTKPHYDITPTKQKLPIYSKLLSSYLLILFFNHTVI